MEQKNINNSRILAIFSAGLFLLSLTQSAFTVSDLHGNKTYSSLEVFLGGSVAILGGGTMEWIVWLSNPIYLLAIIFLLAKKRAALTLSVIAFLLSFSFLMWQQVLVSESGRNATILHRNAGYFIWLLSLSLLAAGARSFFRSFKKKPEQRPDPSIILKNCDTLMIREGSRVPR